MRRSVRSSPCLCGKQLVIVGGALVIILSVSDDCGEAFTYQSLCYVAGKQDKERKITLKKKKKKTTPLGFTKRVPGKLALNKKKMHTTNPKGGFAKEQRSLKC